jgi:mono/diheme cytochrome c family protein/rhodanese-related sulfurtransferase
MFLRFALVGLGIAGSACASKDPPPPTPPVPVVQDAAPVASVDAASTDPEVVAGTALWGKYCALCHGPKATGYAADNAPSLVTETFLATASDDYLRAGIGRGRPGTAMAGYSRSVGGPLDDGEIGQLIAFLRNGAPPPALLSATPVEGDPVRGATVYREKCQECHGTAEVRGEAIHLANPVFLETATDAFIRYAIAFGRPGTKMAAFAGMVPEADIDAAVAYLRSWARPTGTAPDRVNPPATPPTNVVVNSKGKPPTFTLRDGRFVPAAQVKRALDQKRRIVIVDARAPSDWLRSRIRGAVSVPYYDLSGLDALPTDGTWIVAYCACPHHASGVVIDELRKRGVANSVVLDEGVLVWEKLGYPMVIDRNAPPPPKGGHDHHGHDHGHAPRAPTAPSSSPLVQ